ncbi:Spo0E family sporulation regulatory protein-aspartic acid phosphatase [Orenia metallireducens]
MEKGELLDEEVIRLSREVDKLILLIMEKGLDI